MNKLPNNFTLHKYGLDVRFVNENDADFIVKLRTDPKLSRYIHPTSTDVNKQKQWIREYKKREALGEDYYFIYSQGNKPLGVNRLYYFSKDSFATASWVFDPTAPFEAAIAGALIVRTIAFDMLDKSLESGVVGAHVDNKKVVKFNLMLGMRIKETREEEMGKFHTFELTREKFLKNKPKIEKLIGY